MHKNKGFTLVELILVISLGLAISFMAFQSMIRSQDDKTAAIAGQQISQIGSAVNTYITNHYDTISSLTNSTGTSSDPGPRTCVSSTSVCTITVTTLSNEGLLPGTYSGTNIYGSAYTIVIKRSGTSPYYNVSSLITTNTPWKTNSNTIRYDLLGKAMQTAGIDSGMSRNIATRVDGYKGLWGYSSSDFSNITQLGQLAYIAGYGSNSFSVFLRRDGTLPMTGSLNMGANDITNAKGITGSGDLNMGGNVVAGGTGTFGGEVTAENGYGDTITMGGDSSGSDYELRLGSNKPLSLVSNNASNTDTILQLSKGNASFGNRISTNNYAPNDIPTGWGGGLRTWDVVSGGAVAILSAGKKGTDIVNNVGLAAYMNNGGVIYALNSIISSGTISASGNISGNGIYGNYIQSNGSIYSSGNITSDSTITAGGRLVGNEVMKLTNYSALGGACDAGTFSRDSTGALMNCIGSKWTYMRAYQVLSPSSNTLDSACVGSGDVNPPNYSYPQWAITCGSRYCVSQGFTSGYVTESPGVSATKPYGSNSPLIRVSCAR